MQGKRRPGVVLVVLLDTPSPMALGVDLLFLELLKCRALQIYFILF